MRWHMPSPKTWAHIHSTLAGIWLLMTIPAVLWWRDSVPFLVAVSIYANFAGSVAGWQSARADLNSPTCEHIDRLERKIESVRRQLAAKR